VLYKDAGFQGYEPAVQETRQAKKNNGPAKPTFRTSALHILRITVPSARGR
jgi:hypothetical protein